MSRLESAHRRETRAKRIPQILPARGSLCGRSLARGSWNALYVGRKSSGSDSASFTQLLLVMRLGIWRDVNDVLSIVVVEKL